VNWENREVNLRATMTSALDTAREHLYLARSLRGLRIRFDADLCTGRWQCYEVCPIGCWVPDLKLQRVHFRDAERCIACGACVLQCPEDAIELS